MEHKLFAFYFHFEVLATKEATEVKLSVEFLVFPLL